MPDRRAFCRAPYCTCAWRQINPSRRSVAAPWISSARVGLADLRLVVEGLDGRVRDPRADRGGGRRRAGDVGRSAPTRCAGEAAARCRARRRCRADDRGRVGRASTGNRRQDASEVRLGTSKAPSCRHAPHGGRWLCARGRGRPVDSRRFERLVATGDYAGGLALWRGDLLADLADLSFVAPERARLEELRLFAIESRIEAQLDSGHHAAGDRPTHGTGRRASTARATDVAA